VKGIEKEEKQMVGKSEDKVEVELRMSLRKEVERMLEEMKDHKDVETWRDLGENERHLEDVKKIIEEARREMNESKEEKEKKIKRAEEERRVVVFNKMNELLDEMPDCVSRDQLMLEMERRRKRQK
jgi:hypothetical protein